MRDSLRVIKDVAETIKSISNKDTLLTLVLRFGDVVDKAELKSSEFLPTLWNFIDQKHPLYESKLSGLELTSVAIQDDVGNMIYDSNSYLSISSREKLQSQQDFRVREFTKLSQEDKERTVDILAQQIKQGLPAEKEKKETKTPDSWDDFLNNL